MVKFFSIFNRNPASLKRELAMKKILLLSLAVLLMLIPGTAYAQPPPPVTVTIAPDGLSFNISVIMLTAVTWEVIFCDGETKDGIDPFYVTSIRTIPVEKPISYVKALANDPLTEAEASRNCESIGADGPGAESLFMMWLLTRDDQGCILLSETHPSVERQKALCFPATDPDWVADSAPCADYVYDNDTWSCDAFGFSRLPLYDEDGPDLMEVWQRHAARQEE
jgi:hypothetical protein